MSVVATIAGMELWPLAQCRGPHLRDLVRRLWPGWMALGAVTIAAPGLGGNAPTAFAQRGLGFILIAYGAWGLWRPTLADLSRRNPWLCAAVGAATGAVTASTAVFAWPWVPYLQSLRLGKDEMVQALGALLRGRLAGPAFQKALFGRFIVLGTLNLARAG